MKTKLKKPRLVFIDLIRVVAIFFVIFHHLHFHFLDMGLFSKDELWSNSFFGLSYGDIGVSLFIFISGLSLTISSNYGKFNIIKFFSKRIKNIYPEFFIAYFFFFCWYAYMKYLPKTVDFPGLLLSLTGLDTYLISFFDFKFYSLFDWFIGFILILYLIFPLMYSIYKKNQFLLLFTAISLLSFTLYISNNQIDSRFITLRILEFSLGMLYAKTALSKNNGNHFLILMFSLLALFTFYTTSTVIFFFIRLIIVDYIFIETAYFICSHFKKNKIINKSITYLASISYLIFLLQHQVIIRIMGDIFLPNKVFFAPAFISSLLFQSIFIILFIIFFAVMLSKIGKIIFNRFMISK